MAYKPEKISRTYYSRNVERRLRRDAKRAATRVRRRAAKLDPENAPTRVFRGVHRLTQPGYALVWRSVHDSRIPDVNAGVNPPT